MYGYHRLKRVILQYIPFNHYRSLIRGIVAYAIGNRNENKFAKDFLSDNVSIDSFHSSLK